MYLCIPGSNQWRSALLNRFRVWDAEKGRYMIREAGPLGFLGEKLVLACANCQYPGHAAGRQRNAFRTLRFALCASPICVTPISKFRVSRSGFIFGRSRVSRSKHLDSTRLLGL